MYRDTLAEALAAARRSGTAPAPALLSELRRVLCCELALSKVPQSAVDLRAMLFWLGEILQECAGKRKGWLRFSVEQKPLFCRVGARMTAHALLCLVGVLSPKGTDTLSLEANRFGNGVLVRLWVQSAKSEPLALCSLRWHCARAWAARMGGRLLACRGRFCRGAALWLPGISDTKKIEKPPELFDFIADRYSPLYLLAGELCVPPDE